MSVLIAIPPAWQPLAGDLKEIETAGNTVGECLDMLVKILPRLKSRLFTRKGRLVNGVNIFINGENAYPESLAKAVRTGDKIHIASTVVGG